HQQVVEPTLPEAAEPEEAHPGTMSDPQAQASQAVESGGEVWPVSGQEADAQQEHGEAITAADATEPTLAPASASSPRPTTSDVSNSDTSKFGSEFNTVRRRVRRPGLSLL